MEVIRYETGGFEVKNIKDGDYMIAGCACHGMADFGFVVDFDKLEECFTKVDNVRKNMDPQRAKQLLDGLDCKLDLNTYLCVYSFSYCLQNSYKDISDNFHKRSDFYNSGKCTLSGAIKNKVCACPEMSTMAQIYFQKNGVKSTLVVGGALLGKKSITKDTVIEPHIYNIIEDKSGFFIYDASRPITEGLVRANIYCVNKEQKKSFDSLKEKNIVMMKALSIYDKTLRDFFGNTFDSKKLPQDKIWDASEINKVLGM